METPITNKEKYAATHTLLTSSEAVSWNRLNTFLVLAAMFLAGYFLLYVNQPPYAAFICTVLCIFGAVIGKWWAAFGLRGRTFEAQYTEIGKSLELAALPGSASEPRSAGQLSDQQKLARAMELGPYHLTEHLRESANPWSPSSFEVLRHVPRLFSLVFLILCAMSWVRWFAP